MGIAKWRINNAHNSEDERKFMSHVSSKDAKDMELAYTHVRYQKSFDAEDQKEKNLQYSEMKKNRQIMLKPFNSKGLKKFGKKYENIRKDLLIKKRKERLKSEKIGEYRPPKYTKIAEKCFQEEIEKSKIEEMKRQKKLEANKKRDKYWLLVRDLHPPQISQTKKEEMKHLISKVNNGRTSDGKKRNREKINSSTKHESERSSGFKKYFSSGIFKQKNHLGNSTENLVKPVKYRMRRNYKKRSPRGHSVAVQENKNNKSFDYLKHKRNLREQSGDGYPTRAAEYIENTKQMEEQNSQVLVNMARMCESEAKRKEQLLNVQSSITVGNSRQINQMYVNSIKAKLAYLNQICENE